MREAEISVKFEPQGNSVYVLPGTRLIEAAGQAGITFNTPCGGQGTCRKCRVQIVEGACPPQPSETKAFSDQETEAGWRLACQACVCAPATVDVPETSLLTSTFQILGGTATTSIPTLDVSSVAVRKRYIVLDPPSREDETPDADRVQRALGPCSIDLALLRELPGKLRRASFRGTAVLADHTLVDFEEGNTEAFRYAAAIDIGTTTLAAVLIDLVTGHQCASVSRMNPQTSFGDDVIARILFVREKADGLHKLHDVLLSEINDMLRELAETQGVSTTYIYELSLAGNTTMQHLVEGVDPSALGEVPFTPATGNGLMLKAGEFGANIHPRGCVYVFPVIGGFVGGDTVAGLLATHLAEVQRPTVLVDIGTNGEIVVCHDGRLVSASTAAGPAFEGARITYGMRATTGAIEKVIFERTGADVAVRIGVIGNATPAGLCGSALIDSVAELLRHGILLSQGLLLGPKDVPPEVPASLRQRLIETEDGAAFVLASEEETQTGRPVLLTQKDIRELQLATAAIRAGFTILLRRVGLDVTDLERVLIAGGFGNFIRRGNAQRIGLLPSTLQHHQMVFVGNTSLAGAKLAAVSPAVREQAQALARRTRHVDLSTDPGFYEEYVAGMFFPEQEDVKDEPIPGA